MTANSSGLMLRTIVNNGYVIKGNKLIMGVIYKGTCKTTGKSYIGSTVSFKCRLYEFEHGIGKSKFVREIRRYGSDDFVWEILEKVDDVQEMRYREILAIVEHKTLDPDGYNTVLAPGGRCKSVLHTETGKIYPSISEAADDLGISGVTARNLCNEGTWYLRNTVDFFSGHLQWYDEK